MRPVKVRLGLSDGTLTEVESAELKEETPVVVGEMESQPADGTCARRQPLCPANFPGCGQAQREGR